MKTIDLHLHSTKSDGSQSPEEIVQAAYEEGLSAIAYTDHNTFAIYKPTVYKGVECIPGCEFSTKYNGPDHKMIELHVVGLFFHGVDSSISKVFESIHPDDYILAVLKSLEIHQIFISLEELKNRYHEANIGRVQIADYLVEKGYVKDFDEAMDCYIGNRSPYYINRVECMSYMELKECVKVILQYGGLPILAHPYHYKYSESQIEQLVQDFRKLSEAPLGIEVDYRDYNEAQKQFLHSLAIKYNLLESAGSDRHKPEKTPFQKGDYHLLEIMKESLH